MVDTRMHPTRDKRYPSPKGTWSAWRLVPWLLVLVVVAMLATLVAAPFYVYSRFNAEQPIAEITFRQLGDKRYLAALATGDLCSVRTFEIHGDQWQLDASFVKWRGIGTLLGLDSLYRLDRLSGRYANVAEQNAAASPAYDVAPRVLVDVFTRRGEKGLAGWLVDTHYGSSVYLDIDPARRYRVYKTEDALIARAMAPETDVTTPGEVTLVIDKACGQRAGVIGRWIAAVNTAAVSLL
jgi:hypothetical protein